MSKICSGATLFSKYGYKDHKFFYSIKKYKIYGIIISVTDRGNNIETKSDGSFSYYCSCGNPVNDSELCGSYTYNDETKEIEFDSFETTKEMITNVKIVEMPEDVL